MIWQKFLKMQLLWFAVTGARGELQTRTNINRSRTGWMKTGHEPRSRYKVSKLTKFLINDLKSPFDAFSLIPSCPLYFCLRSSHFISTSHQPFVQRCKHCTPIHTHIQYTDSTLAHTHTGTCMSMCTQSCAEQLLHYFSLCTNVNSEATSCIHLKELTKYNHGHQVCFLV